jgi:secreted protein
VALLAVPILRLTKVFDELIVTIRSLNQSTNPLIEEVTKTVVSTNEQLEKMDDITSNVSDASANVSALSSLVTSTVGQPLIKVASFSYGVRQAFRGGSTNAQNPKTPGPEKPQQGGEN